MRLCKLSSLAFMAILLTPSDASATKLENTVDHWLDPALASKKESLLQLLAKNEADFGAVVKDMPENDPHKIWGRAHLPGSGMDLQLLYLVKSIRGTKIERVSVADLGCGRGDLAALVVLAGGRVDAVEFPARAKLANENIYQSTQSVIGYDVKDAKTYFATHGCSLLAKEPPTWTKKPHEFIYCFGVVHYFTETQIRFLATRVFDNLKPGGCFAVFTDAPFWCQGLLDYYNGRRGKFACPGMGIYSIKKNGQYDYESHIIPYDPEKYSIRPGDFRSGIFREDGTTDNQSGWCHYFFSTYMLDDLAAIFESVGLKVVSKYYLLSGGDRTEDEKLIKANSIPKTCIYLAKPE